MSIDLVCMMEKIDNISPALADIVMNAGYHAIDVLCSNVSCFSLVICILHKKYFFLCVAKLFSK